jgi:BirA family transcriptional regulator, biotin operon repressor / biotin---[acetyl-CoA-carboxylase] ligase
MSVANAPIKWPAEAIWEVVAPILPNFTVEVLPEIDSTNTELMRRAKSGHIEPILLVAEKQTAGRGRLGREWHELAKREETLPALTFSLGLPLSPADWSGLSLAVGVSVAQSLHTDIGLKWPNDLWLHDRKLAGILIETCAVGQARYVVVGVGINITQPAEKANSHAEPLRRAPAWLQELLPQMSSPEALLRIVPTLIQTLLIFAEQGFAPFQSRFQQRDVLIGRQISVDNNRAGANEIIKTTGTALGVNSKGELEMQTTQGKIIINSSEVSISPSKTLPH